MAYKKTVILMVSGIGLLQAAHHGWVANIPANSDHHASALIKPHKSIAPSSLSVELTNDRLSLGIDNRPLQEVVQAVTQKTNISIIVDKEVPNANVAVHVDNASVSAGLQQLFENYDTFFFFDNGLDTKAKLATVWVYPKAKGENYSPNPGNQLAAYPTHLEATNPLDAQNRAETAASTIQKNGPEAESALQTALNDSEDNVRINALQAATLINLDIPSDQLKEVALYDSSETMRSMAISYLRQQLSVGRITEPDVVEIANSSLNDPSPIVAETAKQILASLEEAESTAQADADDPQRVVSR